MVYCLLIVMVGQGCLVVCVVLALHSLYVRTDAADGALAAQMVSGHAGSAVDLRIGSIWYLAEEGRSGTGMALIVMEHPGPESL